MPIITLHLCCDNCQFWTKRHASYYFTYIVILMQLAQKLYEGVRLSDGTAAGLITYMRTDGLHVSIAFAASYFSGCLITYVVSCHLRA